MFNSRLQNLAITLDKVKHFLDRQPVHLRDALPMRLMTEDEIMSFLWNDKNSVLKRLCNAGLQAFRDTDPDASAVFIQLRQDLLYTKPSSVAAVKAKMAEGKFFPYRMIISSFSVTCIGWADFTASFRLC